MGLMSPAPPTVPAGQLLADSLTAGVRFRWDRDRLKIGGPKRHRELLDQLADRRDELAELLRPGLGESVRIAGQTYAYERWDGQQLGQAFALDTETRRIESEAEIPELALASASDGRQHVLVHPRDVAGFIAAHVGATVCMHNCSFDVWVLDRHLTEHPIARGILWKMVDEGRIRDSLLLHSLYQLAKRDEFPRPRDLATLAKYYLNISINKADPFRLRFGSIIGKDWNDVPCGYFDYAITDAIATYLVYDELVRRARKVESDYNIPPEVIRRWGHLTERIQVQGSIALAAVERTGVHVDRGFLGQLRDGLQAQRADTLAWLEAEAPGLIKRDKSGELIISRKTGSPAKSVKALLPILESIADQLGERPPLTKTGRLQTSRDYWQQFDQWPFITHWIKFDEITKLLGFFMKLDADRVYPRYARTVRTGRTSSFSPNIQQLPRDGHVREAVVAPPGCSLLAVDYSFIELRTLAAVCEARYGWSRLAGVIREGTDPHCFVAAMFEGVELSEFMTWKQTDKDRFALLRQRAKALNFGIPGGLGAKTLVDYARATYRVELSLDDAKQFRQKLVTEVFPELNLYLSEDAASIVASQLHCKADDVRRQFTRPEHLGCMRRIVKGETDSSAGHPYEQDRLDTVWLSLRRLNRNPELAEAIRHRDTSEETGLVHKLFGCPVATLTGRLRGRVSFTAARNTPFQGLAADGAKLALYELVRAGYTVHAFIHDEFLLSLPDSADWVNEPKRIDRIICQAMGEVCGNVPVEAEGARMKRWYKKAVPVIDEQTSELLVWEPKPAQTVTPIPTTKPKLTESSKLVKPLRWWGGKHYLADWIVERMPPHLHFCEAFAGSAAVLIHRPRKNWLEGHSDFVDRADQRGCSEVANDLLGRLVNFYRVISDPQRFEKFYQLARPLPVSKPLWEEAAELSADPIEDAVRFLVRNRQSMLGRMESFLIPTRLRTRGQRNAEVNAWRNCLDGLPAISERLKDVVWYSEQAARVIQRQDGEHTLHYLDPPYVHATRTTKDAYAHEMSDADHEQLLDTIVQCKGRVMLSGYSNPLYDRWLKDWNRDDIRIDNKSAKSARKKMKTEVLWRNF